MNYKIMKTFKPRREVAMYELLEMSNGFIILKHNTYDKSGRFTVLKQYEKGCFGLVEAEKELAKIKRKYNFESLIA